MQQSPLCLRLPYEGKKAFSTHRPAAGDIPYPPHRTSACAESSAHPLLERLLSLGGLYAALPIIEEDLTKLLKKGSVYPGKQGLLMRGRVSRCHENVSRLWETNKGLLEIVTGYALSDDGIWRQHSWGYAKLSGGVIETTERRTLYFAFVFQRRKRENLRTTTELRHFADAAIQGSP